MKNFLRSLKEKLTGTNYDDMEQEQGYLEIEPNGEERGKVVVRTYSLEDFEDVKPILDSLREGYTIAVINIRPLKDKDLVELKRAVNKMKKTTDAIEGDIAGVGEDYVIITPSFATIHRSKQMKEVKTDDAD